MAGDFGSHSLYKNLGYFSLIGLLRLHTQLGDYHQALQSVANVQLSKKVLATTRVPASQISLYYYVGFCYLMKRRYRVREAYLLGHVISVCQNIASRPSLFPNVMHVCNIEQLE